MLNCFLYFNVIKICNGSEFIIDYMMKLLSSCLQFLMKLLEWLNIFKTFVDNVYYFINENIKINNELVLSFIVTIVLLLIISIVINMYILIQNYNQMTNKNTVDSTGVIAGVRGNFHNNINGFSKFNAVEFLNGNNLYIYNYKYVNIIIVDFDGRIKRFEEEERKKRGEEIRRKEKLERKKERERDREKERERAIEREKEREREERERLDLVRRERVKEGKNKARIYMNREFGMNEELLDEWNH